MPAEVYLWCREGKRAQLMPIAEGLGMGGKWHIFLAIPPFYLELFQA